jgi:glycosyltransferase involved in cell wall biosynthesis
MYYIFLHNNKKDGVKALNLYFQKKKLSTIKKTKETLPLYINNVKIDKTISNTVFDESKLVTVVMTVFNAEDSVEFAILSILNQTYKNIELIIVDDFSTDNSLSIIESIVGVDKRVRIISMESNRGTYVAKNIAIKNSKGDFITFQDADDWSHPERIQTHLTEHKSEKDFSISSLIRIDRKGNIISKDLSLIDRMCHISMMFNRSVIDTNGYFMTSRIGNDSEFLSRIVINTDTTYIRIKKVLMFCSSHPGSLTRAKDTNINSDIRIKSQIEWQNWHNELRINKQVGRIDFNEKDYDWKIIK